ncbi:MAG: tannase/feruloyl esterase family alpha/beta hydrolase [Acidobacteriota bacterium]
MTITLAQTIEAGGFRLPTPAGAAPAAAKAFSDLPAFCRVVATLKPSSDSDIKIEVWLPASGWNGTFQGVGNGGYAGTLNVAGLADAVSRGSASASTDTGHADANGTSAGWALHHPEKIVDFGHRAVHETAVSAKAIIRAFYGQDPRRSYFNSCSNGGRQALMEAQRYPGDYDGIVAGAPANYWTRLLSFAASNAKATLADAGSYIAAAKLPAIEAAALAACDASDGVKDGVIENPLACRFDPAVLLCKSAESDSCLTRPQMAALQALYGGLKDADGKTLFPGYSPGGEAEPGGWAEWITGNAPEKSLLFAFGTQFFKNMVFEDADWQFRSFDAVRDTQIADGKMADALNATDPDLSAFRKRGGKLILFHGWSDAAIPAVNTIDYYRSVVAKAGAKEAETFVRLYMIPGMQHCGGGPGPNVFGHLGVARGDRTHDIDAALEDWVEQSIAPDQIVASKYNGVPRPGGDVVRTRPLCPYPLVAEYTGTGNTDDAANFMCKTR